MAFEKKKKKKFYVVWEGHKPGVYETWAQCQSQIKGYPNAKFKSFDTLVNAQVAYHNPAKYAQSDPKKKKTVYYVVWHGAKPGIYTDWDEALKQIRGVKMPKYKSFGSKELAEKAFLESPDKYMGRSFKKTRDLTDEEKERIGEPNPLSICVDAACNSSGKFEYRGVITDSATQIFHFGPETRGTNNIGEFLALVHGLAYLKQSRSDIPIYSDSKIAMGWVQKKVARTSSKNPKVQKLIKRAEKWLKDNTYPNEILKWETKAWGDIPADFNRK